MESDSVLRLSIRYNPYLPKSTFRVNDEPIDDMRWTGYLQNRRLHTWFYPAANWRGFGAEVADALNEEVIEVAFNGRKSDYEDLALFCREWNAQNTMQFILLPQKRRAVWKEDKKVLCALDGLMDTFGNSLAIELHDPALLQQYRTVRSNELNVAVIATMSSGKSTLINALLGRDLLPSSNDATTAKITRIRDNDDAENFTVECRDRKGILVHERCFAAPELLDDYNADEQVFYVDMEGDIPGLSNDFLRLNILDTPGPNNSATKVHREVTNTIIHDRENPPVILYVMDSTKPEDESDANFLQDIADVIKKGGRQAQERFIFVMNKADALDVDEDGSVVQVVRRRQEYLQRLGIDATQIIPVSASAAKLLRIQQRGLPLNKKQSKFLNYAMEDLCLDEAACLSPFCADKLARIKQEAKERQDQEILDLIATGIVGLELTINEYLDKYAYPDKIGHIGYLLQEKLNSAQLRAVEIERACGHAEMLDEVRQMEQKLERILKTKEETDDMGNVVLSIRYNPYLLESHFKVNGESADDTKWAGYLHKRRLQTWFYPASNWKGFAQELEEALNEDSVEIEFSGRKMDYVDLELFCRQWNEDDRHMQLKPHQQEEKSAPEDKDVLHRLDALVDTFRESPVKEMRDPELLKKYQQARGNEFCMAVVATMSSGKSTLINALLGYDLLPASNDATTAKITRIQDNDGAEGFEVECRDRQGTLVYEKCPATAELMDMYNKDERVFFVDAEGDIPGISSQALRLTILDTPGPNNSATQEHREVTNTVVHDRENQPIILYVMDSTKPEDESDANFLRDIADVIKKGGRQAQERFIFVMNKADALDEDEDGSVAQVVCRRQEYLQRLGINATQIIPISASAAKLLRMQQNGLPLSKKQHKFLDYALEDLCLDEAACLSPSCADKLARMKQEAEEQQDQDMLDLIATGIVGLELTINEYLEKYAYPYKISRIIDTFSARLNEKHMLENYQRMLSEDREMQARAEAALQHVSEQRKKLEERSAEIKEKTQKMKFDEHILQEYAEKFAKRMAASLRALGYPEVIQETQKNKLIHDIGKAQRETVDAVKRQLQQDLDRQLKDSFSDFYQMCGELMEEFKSLKIPGINMGKMQLMISLGNQLESMESEDIESIVNAGDYSYTKTRKGPAKINPERQGFLGFFKF